MSVPLPNHPLFIDITGHKYNRLTVTSYAGRFNKVNKWNCLCDCGKETIVATSKLTSSHSKSCGCLSKEKATELSTTHGGRDKPEYDIWCGVKNRCLNPKVKSYPDYGGRGIKICERWLNSFESFFSDMGERPSKNHSIDRIDNDGGYSPDNCKWSTKIEQMNNRSNTRFLEYSGGKITYAEASRALGLSHPACVQNRVKRGWSAEKIMNTPNGRKSCQ